MNNFSPWSNELESLARKSLLESDPGHDFAHVQRVVRNVLLIGATENANPSVTIPAAWLHDCVPIAKDSPLRSSASRLAADHAIELLQSIDYPSECFPAIHHAIVAHSFSANIPCETIEAAVVQDADRIEALGAIGIARCIMTGVLMMIPLYDEVDPIAEFRDPDDSRYSIDHFKVKLFKLADTMKTRTGRELAARRSTIMHDFYNAMAEEVGRSKVDCQSDSQMT